MPPDRDEQPVRVFSTFTEDLEMLSGELGHHGGDGIYRGVLDSAYDVLEQHGVKPCLVDARGENVPGRRTDWHECQ